jgi:hypothetical protein
MYGTQDDFNRIFHFYDKFGSGRSGDEDGVEFFDDVLGIAAESLTGDREGDAFIGVDALPGVEVGVLIGGGEGTVEGDVVFVDVEPVALGVGEAPAVLGEPMLVAGFDEFGEGRERSLLGIDGVADEGDQVGEGKDGVLRNRALFEMFVGFPEFVGSDVLGRPGDAAGGVEVEVGNVLDGPARGA